MKTVTKKFDFCYGHCLPGYHGKCKNIHGHNSVLEIEVSGYGNFVGKKYKDMIIDFSDLKSIVKEKVINVLDHQNLNDMEYFKNKWPTAENIVDWIYIQLIIIFGDDLIRIRLYETPTSYCEWKSN